MEITNETQKSKFGISDEKILLWFIIIPLFLSGIHLGIIFTHISLNFSFYIPFFVRLSGILTGICLLLGLYFVIIKWTKE